MRAALPLLVTGCVLLAGCTGSSESTTPKPTPPAPDPSRSVLVDRADLDRCPATTAQPVGDGLPDVTLPCLGAGPEVRLAALRGPLVMNVWGSWCGPCQRETPYIQDAYAQLDGRVLFLGVDDEDDPDSALDFAAHVRPAMHYPSVVDEDKSVLLGLHGPVAVPQTLFIGTDGRVVHTTTEAYSSTDDLLADIARYLGVRA